MKAEDFEDEHNDIDVDTSCETCGEEMQWEDCWSCGGEGGRDGEDLMMEDPMWYGPDDFEICDTCHGKGGYLVCHNAQNHKQQS